MKVRVILSDRTSTANIGHPTHRGHRGVIRGVRRGDIGVQGLRRQTNNDLIHLPRRVVRRCRRALLRSHDGERIRRGLRGEADDLLVWVVRRISIVRAVPPLAVKRHSGEFVSVTRLENDLRREVIIPQRDGYLRVVFKSVE